MLKSEFHTTVMSQNIILPYKFFDYVNVKIIVSSIQRQLAGCIWPIGDRLLTFALEGHHPWDEIQFDAI